MKKKLVSILLSLSMCASYGMPLTAAAADEAPAEDVKVVETVAPNAERDLITSSPSAFKLTTSGSNITMEYGDKLVLDTYSRCGVAGTWADANGTKVDSGKASITNGPTLELAKSTDTKFLTVNGNTIKAENITKNAVPLILTLKATGVAGQGSKEETAEIKLNVTVTPKDLSKVTIDSNGGNNTISAKYDKTTDGKTYNTLDDFANKYKGAKGFTTELTFPDGNKVSLSKKDFKSVSAFVDTTNATKKVESGKTLYYIVNNTAGTGAGQVTGGSIVTTAGIKVEGKGNYKGTFKITGQAVSLQPQRVNVGTISGATVTYGSIWSLLDGMTTDDYAKPEGEASAIAKQYKFTFKSAAKSKPIKIDAKNGEVSVKDVSDKEAEREVVVTIQNKKNKLCTSDVKFKVTPLDISGSAFDVNFEKVIGKADKPKTYKNFVDFEKKFLGNKPDTDPKGNGLVFTYTPDGSSKATKLKSNKDFVVSMKVNGVKSNAAKSGNLEPTAYLNANNEVVTTATIVIKGKGKFTGVITEDALVVPMEIQTVTCAGAAWNEKATVTFASINEVNIFDNISIDNELDKNGKPVAINDRTDKEEIIKQLKVKAEKDSGLKVDKNGYVTVKNVPSSKKGKITVSSKKNNKSVDALYTVEFDVCPATVTDANIRIDVSKVDGKTFTDLAAAKKQVEKVPVVATIGSKDKKLKGSDKDYDRITVTQVNADPNVGAVGSALSGTQTGPALMFTVSATMKGNYQGTVTNEVNCTAKK